MVLCVGMTIGIIFYYATVSAIDDITGHNLFEELLISLCVLVVGIPVWKRYILPQALEHDAHHQYDPHCNDISNGPDQHDDSNQQQHDALQHDVQHHDPHQHD